MADNYNPRTYEEIHDSMLETIRDDVDKREGSIVFDMTAPPAEQLEMLEYEIRASYLNGFADTADLPFLIRRASEMGVDWKEAEKARGTVTVYGNDNTDIPAGFRVFTDSDEYFETTEDGFIEEDKTTIPAIAVEGGAVGNIGIGEINDFERTVPGITEVTNDVQFSGGIDAETHESLLNRYHLKVRKPITSGNPYHYEKWATDVEGVATAKVFPLHAGPGTVKVVVVAEDGRAPSEDTISKVAARIEGERPIGADVTVEPVEEVALSISVSLTLEGDLKPTDVLEDVESSIDGYLLETSHTNVVRYVRIGEAILDASGVIDYEDLTLNGGTTNVTVADEAVAVVGEVDIV